jgi:hypothetical protein
MAHADFGRWHEFAAGIAHPAADLQALAGVAGTPQRQDLVPLRGGSRRDRGEQCAGVQGRQREGQVTSVHEAAVLRNEALTKSLHGSTAPRFSCKQATQTRCQVRWN